MSDDLEKLVTGSFLRHVPEIMSERDCSIDEAIQLAFDHDEVFLAEMSSPGVRAQVARKVLCDRVYRRIRGT